MKKSYILRGDAIEALKMIPDNTVDCCVTSPPYYGLRDYDADGQIGLEETPEEYIERLVEVFREVRRVLRNDGTLWLNIGDSYAGSGKGRMRDGTHSADISKSSDYLCRAGGVITKSKTPGIKRKELIGIPWMLAFALRADGWYLRQDIIWYKPNTMPESVKDRCTKSHEYVFLLSKSPTYYFDSAAIREPAVGYNNAPVAGSKGTLSPNTRLRKGNSKTFRGGGAYTNNQSFFNSASVERQSSGNAENPTGLRNKRDVWSVATQGYSQAHFATFPEKLVIPCVLAGCRQNGTVLDPFLGSGTTAVVAKKYRRNFIGIELNPHYASLSQERLKDWFTGLRINNKRYPRLYRMPNRDA